MLNAAGDRGLSAPVTNAFNELFLAAMVKILSVLGDIVNEGPESQRIRSVAFFERLLWAFGSRPMDGKSIGNSRMHRLIDGLVRLNSGKILTFTKVRFIKRSHRVRFWGLNSKNRCQAAIRDRRGRPADSLRVISSGRRDALRGRALNWPVQWRQRKEHMVHLGNPGLGRSKLQGLGLGQSEIEW